MYKFNNKNTSFLCLHIHHGNSRKLGNFEILSVVVRKNLYKRCVEKGGGGGGGREI